MRIDNICDTRTKVRYEMFKQLNLVVFLIIRKHLSFLNPLKISWNEKRGLTDIRGVFNHIMFRTLSPMPDGELNNVHIEPWRIEQRRSEHTPEFSICAFIWIDSSVRSFYAVFQDI